MKTRISKLEIRNKHESQNSQGSKQKPFGAFRSFLNFGPCFEFPAADRLISKLAVTQQFLLAKELFGAFEETFVERSIFIPAQSSEFFQLLPLLAV